jgi:hypothetical protein
MAHSDWIPHREQDFVDLCKKWVFVLSNTEKQTEYGWVASECTALLNKINHFLTLRTDYETVNSTANRIAKDEAKGETIDDMRDFANTSIRFNKKMTDADKQAMGISPKDTTPTTHAPPEPSLKQWWRIRRIILNTAYGL